MLKKSGNTLNNRKVFFEQVVFLLFSILLVALFYKHISILGGGIMEDDSYFYAQIAYNLGVNGISSFDTINITSGYHLLWGWLLGTVSFCVSIFSLDKNTHLFSMFVVYWYLALNLAYHYGKNIFERIILFSIATFLTMLMETGLLSLLLLAFAHTFFIGKNNSKLGYIAAFLIPLARIDAVIFLFVPIAYLFFIKETREIAFRVSATILSGMLCHFACMYLLFDHFFSVSSLMKSGSDVSIIDIVTSNISGYTSRKLAVIVVLIGLSYILAFINKKIEYLLLISGSLLFLAVHVVFNYGIRDWYYMPVYAVVLYVLFQQNRIARSVVYVLCLMLIARWGYSAVDYRVHDRFGAIVWQKEFVRELQEIVPPESRIYLFDGSGWMGYFSERMVINGDGLVNSYDYYERSQQNKLDDYLDQMQVAYIITNVELYADIIINHHGLVVNAQDVELLIDVPDNIDGGDFHKWRLFRLKHEAE